MVERSMIHMLQNRVVWRYLNRITLFDSLTVNLARRILYKYSRYQDYSAVLRIVRLETTNSYLARSKITAYCSSIGKGEARVGAFIASKVFGAYSAAPAELATTSDVSTPLKPHYATF